MRRIAFFTCTCGIFPTGRPPVRRRWASWPEPWAPAALESIQLSAALRSQAAHDHTVNGKRPLHHKYSGQVTCIAPVKQ